VLICALVVPVEPGLCSAAGYAARAPPEVQLIRKWSIMPPSCYAGA
jgi:hypothetical protein